MTWWLKNFKWKQNTNGLDKNPQNIVPWRPKKWISLVNEELKQKWYRPATKKDIEENYMQILQLEEEELKEMIKNKSKPMLVRIIAKNMLWWKWFDIIERMLDRWIWKAIQKQEITWKDWESIKIDTKDINNKKTEDLIEIIQSKLK